MNSNGSFQLDPSSLFPRNVTKNVAKKLELVEVRQEILREKNFFKSSTVATH